VIDIGEGMCYGEHCELCKTVESQTCTSESFILFFIYTTTMDQALC